MHSKIDCQYGFVEQAKRLIKELDGRDWPDDIDVSGSYPHVLARVRREATNYEEVLEDLNAHCVKARGAACPLRPEEMLEVINEGQAVLTWGADQLAHYLIFPDWFKERINRH